MMIRFYSDSNLQSFAQDLGLRHPSNDTTVDEEERTVEFESVPTHQVLDLAVAWGGILEV